MPLNTEECTEVAEWLNVPADKITAENALGILKKATKNALDTADGLAVKLSRTEEELETAREENGTLLSQLPSGELPEATIEARDEMATLKIDLAVSKGHVPPLIAKQMKAAIAPAEGVMLSRSANGTGLIPIDDVLGWFDGSKLGQGHGEDDEVFLSQRKTPGTENAPAPPAKLPYQEMADRYNTSTTAAAKAQ